MKVHVDVGIGTHEVHCGHLIRASQVRDADMRQRYLGDQLFSISHQELVALVVVIL